MKLLEMILITIHLTGISCKKKHKEISSESIENILYYKDCNHKQNPTPIPLLGSPPPKQQECKMCCTMCCGDQCVDSHQVKLGRQAGMAQLEPKGIMPIQPDIKPPRERRKKQKFPAPIQPPLPGRRGLGPIAFTRENIKSLISQDEDIRKILKDLVRVTMQKVDLMQLLNNKQNVGNVKQEHAADVSDSENDL
ncbi:uncharacterized protein LOC120626951 [Pararge aegeria]|uniref:Jg6118 protein n=1 Tax=Pararge aegeria aegeria TaxID=348720 RepID=A0A8S4RFE3_9NEOP|nr:uncharacterized protein LOC120626951 [Pararge aegeria]CAH2234441.1 jg6118 [Pararge aegeria aegeria]